MFRVFVAFVLMQSVLLTVPAALAGDGAGPSEPDVLFEDLVMRKGVDLALLHTSLDGLPPVPKDGLVFHARCTVGADGQLGDCQVSCPCGDVAAPFIPAVLKRMAAVEVEKVTKDGAPAVGKTTDLVEHLWPTDRFESSIDFSRGAGINFAEDPTTKNLSRFFPIRAIENDVEALIDLACVVRDDLGASCPDIRVTLFRRVGDRELTEAFRLAALKIVALMRLTPMTRDGKPAPGTAFRKRIRFMLE